MVWANNCRSAAQGQFLVGRNGAPEAVHPHYTQFVLTELMAVGALALPPHEGSVLTQGYDVRLGPPPLSAGCAVDSSLSLINEHTFHIEPGGVSAQLDVERLTGRLGARWVDERGWEWGAQLSAHLYSGGLLDRPLNAYHDLIGLDRIVGEPGQAAVTVAGQGRTVSYQGAALALGTPEVSVGRAFGNLWLKAQLGTGLGSRAYFTNVGAWRAALSAGVEQARWGVAAQVTAPLVAGDLAHLGVRPSAAVSGWAQLSPPLRVSVEARTSPFAQAGFFSRPVVSLQLAWRGVTFQEDLRAPLPDVAFGVAASWRCR